MIVATKDRTLGVRAAKITRMLPYAPPGLNEAIGDLSIVDAACEASHLADTLKGAIVGGMLGVLVGVVVGAGIRFR